MDSASKDYLKRRQHCRHSRCLDTGDSRVAGIFEVQGLSAGLLWVLAAKQ